VRGKQRREKKGNKGIDWTPEKEQTRSQGAWYKTLDCAVNVWERKSVR